MGLFRQHQYASSGGAGMGGAPAAAGGVTDHGSLTGLTPDDDHPQYALADKSRPSPWVALADIPAGIDHGTLNALSLADDDHAQYPLAIGRSGGQYLYGGDIGGGDLYLGSNSFDPNSHTVTIYPHLTIHDTDGTPVADRVWKVIDGLFRSYDLAGLEGRFISKASLEALTDADIPDTITLTNITQIGTRPHSSLTSLGADDHTQYALLAGRAGGQTLIGGTAATDDLTLQANSIGGTITTGDTDYINLKDRVKLFAGGATLSGDTSGFFYFDDTITAAANSTAIRALSFTASSIIDYGANNPSVIQLFNFSATITGTGNKATNGLHTFLRLRPVYSYDVAGTHSGIQYQGAESFPTLTALTSGTAAWSVFRGHISSATIGTGHTIADLIHYAIINPTGSGAATIQTGLDVPAFTHGTTKISVRSAGADVELRHLGAGVFGANAAPNAVAILEAASTTKGFLVPRMTTAQKNAIAAVKGLIVYDTTLDQFEGFQGAIGAWAIM